MFLTEVIIFNLTYALNTLLKKIVNKKNQGKFFTRHFNFKICQQHSDNFIPLGCSQAYFSVLCEYSPEIQGEQRYGVNNFYKHLCSQIHHKPSSSKGNLAVVCLTMALRSPRHRLPPLSAPHDANTHQSSNPWPEKSSCKNLYPRPAGYEFIHIFPILCSFFNVRIKINDSCFADQHRYKISVAAAIYLLCTAV